MPRGAQEEGRRGEAGADRDKAPGHWLLRPWAESRTLEGAEESTGEAGTPRGRGVGRCPWEGQEWTGKAVQGLQNLAKGTVLSSSDCQ